MRSGLRSTTSAPAFRHSDTCATFGSMLRKAGGDAIQGFLVARPAPISDFEALLSKWSVASSIPA
jgi:hypothetical protein